MKKSLRFVIPLAIIALAFVAVVPMSAQAQTSTAVCPAGFYCKIDPNYVSGCPQGWTCIPTTDVSSTPTTPITPVIPTVPVPTSCYFFSTNLTLGSTGPDVVALQTWLINNGYDISSLSFRRTAKGVFGSQTASALTKYQMAVGVSEVSAKGNKVFGYLGPNTRQKINSSCNGGNVGATISSIVPSSGLAGSQVTLYGQGITKNHIISIVGKGFETTMEPTYVDPNGGKIIFNMPSSLIDGTYNVALTLTGTDRSNIVDFLVTSSIPSTCPVGYICTLLGSTTYCPAGYTCTAVTVNCPSGYTCMTYNQNNTTQSSITVLSPNGGEAWMKGTTQYIQWIAPVNITAAYVNIGLVPLSTPCPVSSQTCPSPAPYLLASNVSVNAAAFLWSVGSVKGDAIVPDGSYSIKICPSDGTSNCDYSDSPFKIYSGNSNGQSPVITGVTAPTTLGVNQSGTWIVKAYDPENGPLNYSIDWGDSYTCPTNYTCTNQSPTVKAFVQSSTFTHSYSTVGTYKVFVTVQDNTGLSAQTSSTVQVGGGTSPTCYTFTSNLQLGSTGADVVALQTILIANGYNIPNISSGSVAKGYFDSQTAAAVTLYQNATGQPATGFVGPLTRASLNSCFVPPSVTTCPANQTWNGSSCVPVTPVCPPGYIVNGTPCGTPVTPNSIDSNNVGAGLTMASGSSLSFQNVPNISEDRVGPWQVFSANGTKDIVLAVNLNLGSTKTVKSMLLTTESYGNANFTSDGYVNGKTMYPIVVTYNGQQLNTAYNQTLGTYQPGNYSFKAYADGPGVFQQFYLTVYFTDGTYLTSSAPGNYGTQITCPVGFTLQGQTCVTNTTTSQYPGFSITFSKTSYLPSDTVVATVSRADGNSTPYPVDIYVYNSNSPSSRVSLMSSKPIGQNAQITFQMSQQNVYNGPGQYALLLCDAGQTCNGGVNTNAAVFNITNSTTPPVSNPAIDNVTVLDGSTLTGSLKKGSTYTIKWNESNTKDPIRVSLYLLQNSSWTNILAINTVSPVGNGANSTSWTVPSTLATDGIQYKIYVETIGAGGQQYVQFSSVVQPSVTVFSPNGGESFDAPQPINITFGITSSSQRTYINLVDSNNAGFDLISYNNYNHQNVSDPYYAGGGKSSVSLYVPGDWVSTHGNQYKIELCAANLCDRSDSFFTITSPATTATTTTQTSSIWDAIRAYYAAQGQAQ